MSTQARRLSTRLKRTTETSLMLLGRRRNNKAPAVCVRLEIAADVGLAPGAISRSGISRHGAAASTREITGTAGRALATYLRVALLWCQLRAGTWGCTRHS